MSKFPELVQSRRNWIDEALTPWCRTASRKDLLLAEHAWSDLAGRADPASTLWIWAWSRFPVLIEEGVTSLNETLPVVVTRQDQSSVIGYPDARLSLQGMLFLIGADGTQQAPVSIDEIAEVEHMPE
ncbi:hypothetical protein [Planctomicrobium sp. SH527]|uniref:hypothetical protein n=1 Tax=Planctomicrobium sp. SH527 TaxID=3448123 RepID=UPI003F5BD2C3